MADQTATVESTQAEQSTGSQAEQAAANTQAVAAQDSISIDKYQKVQSEAKNLRERLKKYEEAERSSLSDAEKLQQDRQAFEQEREAFRQEQRHSKALNAAMKAGAIRPEAVAQLIPLDAEDMDKAVRELQKSVPELFPRGSVDGGAGQNGASQSFDMNTLIRQKIAGR